MPKKLTTYEFIKRSKIIHNNKYDYSLIEYINSKIKVKIICSIHGIFEQTPNHHLSGIGCAECKNVKKLNTDEFIKRSNEIHYNKYDYSLVNYINNSTKVKIICPIHDIFEQIPDSHLSNHGCPCCSGNKKSNTEEFIKKSKIIHDNKYDYSLVDYKGANKKVFIICKEHKRFEQTPHDHLNGIGCPICNESKGEKEINIIIK